MPDPTTMTNDELRAALHAAIAWDPMFPTQITDEQKRHNGACMTEYVARGLTDYVIDDFIEWAGMMGLSS